MHLFLPKYLADTCTTGGTSGLISPAGLPQTCANSTTLNTAFLIGFTIIGGIAFLFLIIGGVRYITAGGNAESIQKAKNQITYSLIGLVIAASAATIVNFVLDRLK